MGKAQTGASWAATEHDVHFSERLGGEGRQHAGVRPTSHNLTQKRVFVDDEQLDVPITI